MSPVTGRCAYAGEHLGVGAGPVVAITQGERLWMPMAYLTLTAIVNGHKQSRIDELLPWNYLAE
jgi:hypothetical protein